MIELVASDMDGTLLNSKKELPPRFFPLLERLLRLGVRFAVASGRQYYSLLRTFAPVKDEILFICENGGMVMEKGRTLSLTELDRPLLFEIIGVLREQPGAFPVLCGEKSAYIENDTPFFLENVTPYYARCQKVTDVLEAAKKDRICKIAAFDTGNAETGVYPLLRRIAGRANVCLSGGHWVDLMPTGVNKGTAMRFLQKKLGIGPDECMAFGDYPNDLEMLKACTESYAMANAHPDVLAVCRHTAPSNDEEGVLSTLAAVFGLEFSGKPR